MRYFKSLFIIFLLIISSNGILALEYTSEHENIIKLIKDADKIRFLLDYKIDVDNIIEYKDGRQIAAIDRFTTLDEVMKIMGKYFSVEAAILELEKIGLFIVNDKIGRILADGEPQYYIDADSIFEFIIDENNIKLIKIIMGNDTTEDKRAFYYKLKKQNNEWKIVDEAQEEIIYRYDKKNWVIIRSSSYLSAMNIPYYKYFNGNTLDKDMNTAWVEGKIDDGIGEWVEFSFCFPINISNIGIINGYAKSKDIYEANNRVKRLKVVINNKVYFEAELKDNIMDFQTVKLPSNMSVERIRLIILDVYRGKKYRDTCISEVKFY